MNITLPAVAAASATVHPTEIERDLHLPSVNVLSLAGPGSSGECPFLWPR